MSLLLALTAGGGGSDATASGVTIAEAYSFTAGTATGQSNATATGATLTEAYSFSPGVANGGSPQQQQDGDVGAMRRKKPVIMFRPKAEADLEEALEQLETVRPSDRVSNNKKRVRKALRLVSAINPPPNYADAFNNIEASLKAVAKATARHEGMMDALLSVAIEMQDMIADMKRRRIEQRKKNMQRVLWLI